MSYLKSMFDAPQRRIHFESWPETSWGSTLSFEIEISGLQVHGPRAEFTEFITMAEQGNGRFQVPALTLWQRIKRVPAPVGSYEDVESIRIVTLWTDPELVFKLNMENEDHEFKWRQLYGLVRSAGFAFRCEPCGREDPYRPPYWSK